jgi:uncharacterized protein (TIGR02284 family)
MTDSHHLLDSIVETLADSLAGYTHIGGHAHGFTLCAYCEHQAIAREKAFRALSVCIEAHGWHSDRQGTLLASAHRLFVDLKVAIAHSDSAVMAELHRGESFLLHKIESALAEGRFDRPLEERLRQIAHEVREAVSELEHHLRMRPIHGGAQPARS